MSSCTAFLWSSMSDSSVLTMVTASSLSDCRHARRSARFLKHSSDFDIQVPSDLYGFRITVGSKQTGHLVVTQVHAVGAAINQHGHWRVRRGVRNKANHRFHDERITNDQTDAFRISLGMRLRANGTHIESHEFHQSNFTHGVPYDLPHFRIRRRGGNVLGESAHIGPADRSFHCGDDIFEWLLRNDAPSLDIDRANFHNFDLKVVYARNNVLFSVSAIQALARRVFSRPRGGWNDGTSSQLSL